MINLTILFAGGLPAAGDIGAVLTATLTQNNGPYDLTNASIVSLNFVDPNGNGFTRGAAISLPTNGGLSTYTTVSGDLPIAGIYTVQASIQLTTGQQCSSTIASFKVGDLLAGNNEYTPAIAFIMPNELISAINAANTAIAGISNSVTAAQNADADSQIQAAAAMNAANAVNLAAQSITTLNYNTCALMNVDLAHNQGITCLVYGDVTVAGFRQVYEITNAAVGDTVTFNGVTFTAVASGASGNQFNIGGTNIVTAANIAAALAGNTTINAIYTVTNPIGTDVINITETNPGYGNTPPAMTRTGTITLSNGSPTTSTSDGIWVKQGASGSGYWIKSTYVPPVLNNTVTAASATQSLYTATTTQARISELTAVVTNLFYGSDGNSTLSQIINHTGDSYFSGLYAPSSMVTIANNAFTIGADPTNGYLTYALNATGNLSVGNFFSTGVNVTSDSTNLLKHIVFMNSSGAQVGSTVIIPAIANGWYGIEGILIPATTATIQFKMDYRTGSTGTSVTFQTPIIVSGSQLYLASQYQVANEIATLNAAIINTNNSLTSGVNSVALQYDFLSQAVPSGSGSNGGTVNLANWQIIQNTSGSGNGTYQKAKIPINSTIFAGYTLNIFLQFSITAGMFVDGVSDATMNITVINNGTTLNPSPGTITKTQLDATDYLYSIFYTVQPGDQFLEPYITLKTTVAPSSTNILQYYRAYYTVTPSGSTVTTTGTTAIFNQAIETLSSQTTAVTQAWNDEITVKIVTINTTGHNTLFLNVDLCWGMVVQAQALNLDKGTYLNTSCVNLQTGFNEAYVADRGYYSIDVSNTTSITLTNTNSNATSKLTLSYWFDETPRVPYQTQPWQQNTFQTAPLINSVLFTPLAVAQGVIYGYTTGNGNILSKSTNWGTSFSTVYTFASGSDINNVVVCSNGNILVWLSDNNIYLSTNGGTSFAITYGPLAFPPANAFGVNCYQNIVLSTNYDHNYTGNAQVFRSLDGGVTWGLIFTLSTYIPYQSGYTSHIHSCVYDPYEGIYWISCGDNISWTMIFYSFDCVNWYRATYPQGTLESQPTYAFPLKNCVLFVSDDAKVGISRYIRPVGGTQPGSTLYFDFPLLVCPSWNSGSVPIGSMGPVDYTNSRAYFSWNTPGAIQSGRQNGCIGYGNIYATDGFTVQQIYQRSTTVSDCCYGIWADFTHDQTIVAYLADSTSGWNAWAEVINVSNAL